MAGSLYAWSTTAADNATADALINWAEFQDPSTVNNSARQLMGRVAEWRKDQTPTRTSSGAANVYAITIGSTPDALVDGLTVGFYPHQINTADCYLAVNSFGNIRLRPAPSVAHEAGEIQTGVPVIASYRAASNEWITVAGSGYWVSKLGPGLLSSNTFGLKVGDVKLSLASTPDAGFVRLTETAQALVKTDYPELHAWVQGQGYPWGSAATTFNVPPAGGYFLRFCATDSTVDTGGVRLPGTTQADQNKTHTHAVTGTTGTDTHSHTVAQKVWTSGSTPGAVGPDSFIVDAATGISITDQATPSTTSSNTHSHSVNITSQPSGSSEVRTKNVGMHADMLAVPALVASGLIGASGLAYRLSSSISAADPGAGYLAFDNLDIGSAAHLYVSLSDVNGADLADLWGSITDGTQLIITKVGAPENLIYVQLSSVATIATGWATFSVAVSTLSGSVSAGDTLTIMPIMSGTGGGGSGDVSVVNTIAALSALTANITPAVIVKGYDTANDGGGGIFTWVASDQSANVTADTQRAITVAPDVAPTGASGAWRRLVDDQLLSLWFGAKNDDTADATTALTAWSTYAGVYANRMRRCVSGTYMLGDGSVGNGIQLASNTTYDFRGAYLRRNFIEHTPTVPSDAVIFTHSDLTSGSPLSNIKVTGGKFGADDYSMPGVVLYLWADDSTFNDMTLSKWTSGVGVLWGGSRSVINRLSAMEGDTSITGTGAMRFFGGEKSAAFGCHSQSGDDQFQFAPIAQNGKVNADLSISKCVYVGCSGVSSKGRVYVAITINNAGSGGMTCSIKDSGWIGCSGEATTSTSGGWRVENEDSNGTIEGVFWDDCTLDMAGNTNTSAAMQATRDIATSTVTMTIATPAVVTWTAHGLVAGAPLTFTTTGALPTGVTAGTTYYVSTTGLATDTFELAASLSDALAGTPVINTSGSQSGTHTAALVVGAVQRLRVNGSVRRYQQAALRLSDVLDPNIKLDMDAGADASTNVVDLLNVSGGSVDLTCDLANGSTLIRAGAASSPCNNMAYSVTARGFVNTSTTYLVNLQSTTGIRLARLDLFPGSGDTSTRAVNVSASASGTIIERGDLTRLAGYANRIVDNGSGTRVLEGVQGTDKRTQTTTLTDAATISWDMSLGDDATVTLGGNRTLAAPSGYRINATGTLAIVQDGTGGRTLTWNAAYVNALGGTPTAPSTTAGATTRYNYKVISSSVIVVTKLSALRLSSSTNGAIATWSGTSGDALADSGTTIDTDGTLAANSDTRLATQKAVKTYVDGTSWLAELDYKTSADISSGTIALTSISQSYRHLKLIISGWSHDDGSNRQMRISASRDNGSTWPISCLASIAVGATASVSAEVVIYNYSSTSLNKYLVPQGSGNGLSSTRDTTASAINALRVESTGGNVDGSPTVALLGVL